MATAFLPKDFEQFRLHHRIRNVAATKFWPQVQKLIIHLEQKQWPLFDKQLGELNLDLITTNDAERVQGAFKAIETIGIPFRPGTEKFQTQIQQRIALAQNISPTQMRKLGAHFQAKQKDESINHELNPYFPNKLHKQELVAYNKAS